MVKWISFLSSKEKLQVRILLGILKIEELLMNEIVEIVSVPKIIIISEKEGDYDREFLEFLLSLHDKRN
jgi:hypothetical protein